MVEERPQVLYLESNARVAKLLRLINERQFGDLDAEINVVEDEIAALQLMGENPSGFDAVIVDDARGAHATLMKSIQQQGIPFNITTAGPLSRSWDPNAAMQPVEVLWKPATANQIVSFVMRSIAVTTAYRMD